MESSLLIDKEFERTALLVLDGRNLLGGIEEFGVVDEKRNER